MADKATNHTLDAVKAEAINVTLVR